MNIRNAIIATTSGLLVATAGTAALANQFAVSPVKGGASVNCSVPNQVVCTISSAKGVKAVNITAIGPNGVFDLVDTSYRNCPKQVKVSWDSAYQSSGTTVVECGSLGLKVSR